MFGAKIWEIIGGPGRGEAPERGAAPGPGGAQHWEGQGAEGPQPDQHTAPAYWTTAEE